MIFQASYRESGLGLRCSTHGSRTDFVQSYGFDSGPSYGYLSFDSRS